MLPKKAGHIFMVSHARILCPVFLVMFLAFLLTPLFFVFIWFHSFPANRGDCSCRAKDKGNVVASHIKLPGKVKN